LERLQSSLASTGILWNVGGVEPSKIIARGWVLVSKVRGTSVGEGMSTCLVFRQDGTPIETNSLKARLDMASCSIGTRVEKRYA
jgi:hypothetical protein